ncbi:hypothetical protein GCM10017691_03820 [Pseudonocardia petroleophila]|uniref:DUF3224 domain-containing protein n=1 Tax=Pseudonocardia petroleophila TaxID=37331 RepID=A0A7G7MKQ5_9PSEU|nr:DUF3224 domain-containing protein [Pseudonocardia petroleophila]QNG53366.1 DUF3224 domain-containing protein [Pseudonocardia petroleophila]
MTTTTGRFDLTRWDEEVYDDAEGARLLRVSSTKAFEGGISGGSETQLLQAFAQEGSAAYVGIERVTAAVDGRSGTFVLRHSAVGSATGGSASIDVVPGSATGALTGLRGELSIQRSPDGEHTYAFTYELG